MPIPVHQALGTLVRTPQEIESFRKQTRGASLIIDFGTSEQPDHWYASAWDNEVVEDALDYVAGNRVVVSGSMRKWNKEGKMLYALNIETIILEDELDLEP
jgi:hypothetical protein